MFVKYKNKKISISIKEARGVGKYVGLMFHSRRSSNLLFEFNNNVKIPIHSYFVFFPFLAVWLDEKDKVTEWKIVKPFALSVMPRKSFRKLLEIPLNSKNRQIIDFLVGKGKI